MKGMAGRWAIDEGRVNKVDKTDEEAKCGGGCGTERSVSKQVPLKAPSKCRLPRLQKKLGPEAARCNDDECDDDSSDDDMEITPVSTLLRWSSSGNVSSNRPSSKTMHRDRATPPTPNNRSSRRRCCPGLRMASSSNREPPDYSRPTRPADRPTPTSSDLRK